MSKEDSIEVTGTVLEKFPSGLFSVQLEHERVVVAIQRGERERAANAMRAHIATVREAYEAYAAGTLSRAT